MGKKTGTFPQPVNKFVEKPLLIHNPSAESGQKRPKAVENHVDTVESTFGLHRSFTQVGKSVFQF